MKRKMMIDKKKVFMAVGALSIGMAGLPVVHSMNICARSDWHMKMNLPSVQQYGICRRT